MIPMKVELITIPVSDVDRSKTFYTEVMGFVADVDVCPSQGVRVVQVTPPGSACSIGFGEGLTVYTSLSPGVMNGIHIVVPDIEQASAELSERGAQVTPVIDVGGGVRYAEVADPDGNTLLLQEMSWRTGGEF